MRRQRTIERRLENLEEAVKSVKEVLVFIWGYFVPYKIMPNLDGFTGKGVNQAIKVCVLAACSQKRTCACLHKSYTQSSSVELHCPPHPELPPRLRPRGAAPCVGQVPPPISAPAHPRLCSLCRVLGGVPGSRDAVSTTSVSFTIGAPSGSEQGGEVTAVRGSMGTGWPQEDTERFRTGLTSPPWPPAGLCWPLIRCVPTPPGTPGRLCPARGTAGPEPPRGGGPRCRLAAPLCEITACGYVHECARYWTDRSSQLQPARETLVFKPLTRYVTLPPSCGVTCSGYEPPSSGFHIL